MSDLLNQLPLWLNSYKYLAIFILAIAEGPLLMMTCGFLYHWGQISLVPAFLCLIGGDAVGDLGWYSLGRLGAGPVIRKFGKLLRITPPIIDKIEQRFKNHQNKILFISKITMGFGFALATLISAGILRVPVKKFISLNLLGGIIWTGLLMLLGYFLGNVYSFITEPFKIAFLFFLIAGVITTLWSINRYFIKKELS